MYQQVDYVFGRVHHINVLKFILSHCMEVMILKVIRHEIQSIDYETLLVSYFLSSYLVIEE